MLESIYVGLTGLSTFARGLNNLSNNVANLNTPGFKRSQSLFQDLIYNQQNLGQDTPNNGGSSLGNGVEIAGTSMVFNQGELRQTGNDQDAAIQGNGFFILRDDGNTYYTRAGQFQFDDQGYLTSSSNGARVATLSDSLQLQDFNISSYRTSPPSATTEIQLNGYLSANDLDKKHVISDVNVYGNNGQLSKLKITFTDNSAVTARNWLVQIDDQAGNLVANGSVQFQGDGSPSPGSEEFSFSYTPSGGSPMTLKLVYGQPGRFNGLANFSVGDNSTAKVLSSDGYTIGSLTKISYDAEGQINATYSNGQTEKLGKLALAWFNFLPDLHQEGGNLFVNDTGQEPVIGSAKTSVFGSITGGSIESSNVDLTQQFSELIVTQRGYQASSQVVSTANEMIQQLFDLKSKR